MQCICKHITVLKPNMNVNETTTKKGSQPGCTQKIRLESECADIRTERGKECTEESIHRVLVYCGWRNVNNTALPVYDVIRRHFGCCGYSLKASVPWLHLQRRCAICISFRMRKCVHKKSCQFWCCEVADQLKSRMDFAPFLNISNQRRFSTLGSQPTDARTEANFLMPQH